MGTLILVRHGQGGTLGGDYDRLSPLGEEQARRLGAYWSAWGASFDAVYTGSLRRQRATAEKVAEVLLERGGAWPEPRRLPALDEYDADGILRALLPEAARRDERVAGLEAQYQAQAVGPERNRRFQRLFEAVMAEWVKGTLETDGFESFRAFQARVRQALDSILRAQAGGRRVVVFTSGGPIGVMVQTALAAPDMKAVEINWRVRNCSLTEFVFTPGRLTLESFNALPHLPDPALWTFR